MEKGIKKRRYNLTIGIVAGAVIGLITGLIFQEKMAAFKVVGDLFLRVMQMPIILLVMCAVMDAVGSLNPRELGKLGGKTILLFAFTTAAAGTIGLLLGMIMKPGVGLQTEGIFDLSAVTVPEPASFSEQLLGYVSNNMFASMSSGNNLQCIVIAILFGIALSIYGSKHERNPVLEGIKEVNKIVMQLLFVVIQLLPLAIFSFVSYAVGVIGPQVLSTLAKLIFSNLVGMIVLTVLFTVVTCWYCGVSPLKFFPKFARTAIICIISASSAVALPIKMEDSERKFGISPRINRLVAPMGMSMNTDGAVLFFCLSAITVAQIFNITMTAADMLTLVLFSTAFSFAAISVPGGGLVMLAVVLAAVGLPPEGMVIISAADFFLGPIRTINNTGDDIMVAMVVAKSEGEFDKDIYNGTKEFVPDTTL